MQSLRAIFAIWMRNVTVYKRTWAMNLLPNFFEPFLYLLGMGIGLGSYVKGGLTPDYIAFIAPGLVAVSAMNGASFETTYNMFVRMNFNRLYDAYLASPARISDVIIGEVLWSATRATLYGMVFLMAVGFFELLGHSVITSERCLFVLPALFIVGLVFGVTGALFTSLITVIDMFGYYFTLFLTPMFLFSGIFYPVDRFPYGEQIAWFTPLYHAVRLMRGLMQGEWQAQHTNSLLWLMTIAVVLLMILPKMYKNKLQS